MTLSLKMASYLPEDETRTAENVQTWRGQTSAHKKKKNENSLKL